MTPRQRVEAVLYGRKPDRIPFTIYEGKIPQSAVERRLRNDGLCIVNRLQPLVSIQSPNTVTLTHTYAEGGVTYTRTVLQTPVGELSWVFRPAGFTSWQVEKLFKSPDDYKALLFMIQDQRFVPNYKPFLKAEREFGEDVILRGGIALTPLHVIMISWMGIETFSIEWMENRDKIEKLVQAQIEKLRELYPILANSPASHFNFGGNETGNVMGRERFQKYVIPLYHEAAEVLHKKGKLLGSHLDGNNKVWADLVADSPLDYVEAFTPAPDSDLSLEEAFAAWPNKILWINFTSSLHLKPPAEVEQIARRMLETSRGRRFIMGVTEDIPPDRYQENLLAISRAINSFTP